MYCVAPRRGIRNPLRISRLHVPTPKIGPVRFQGLAANVPTRSLLQWWAASMLRPAATILICSSVHCSPHRCLPSHQIPNLGVTGSNPVGVTNNIKDLCASFVLQNWLEGTGAELKTCMSVRSSNPSRAASRCDRIQSGHHVCRRHRLFATGDALECRYLGRAGGLAQVGAHFGNVTIVLARLRAIRRTLPARPLFGCRTPLRSAASTLGVPIAIPAGSKRHRAAIARAMALGTHVCLRRDVSTWGCL